VLSNESASDLNYTAVTRFLGDISPEAKLIEYNDTSLGDSPANSSVAFTSADLDVSTLTTSMAYYVFEFDTFFEI
jgi:hypothetical protein